MIWDGGSGIRVRNKCDRKSVLRIVLSENLMSDLTRALLLEIGCKSR